MTGIDVREPHAMADPAGMQWLPLRTIRPTGLAKARGQRFTAQADSLFQRFLTAPSSRGMRIGVLAIKGGVGKSFTATGVAATLAEERQARQERVAYIDTDKDAATAGNRVGGADYPYSWWNVLSDAAKDRAAATRNAHRYAMQTSIGMDVYPAPANPDLRAKMTGTQYRQLLGIFQMRYWLSIIDTGTAIVSEMGNAVLDSLDAVIVATSNDTVDDLPKCHETLDVIGDRRPDLARNAIVAAYWRFSTGPDKNYFDTEDAIRGFSRPDKEGQPTRPPLERRVRDVVVVPQAAAQSRTPHGHDPTLVGPAVQAAWRAITAGAMSTALDSVNGNIDYGGRR